MRPQIAVSALSDFLGTEAFILLFQAFEPGIVKIRLGKGHKVSQEGQ